MVLIEPSILSADFARLGEQAKEAETAGADRLQIDVMDGHFVPNITFGAGVVAALHRVVQIPLVAHLMILEPDAHLEAFAKAGAQSIIVHQEACPHLHRSLQTIRKLDAEVGVALNPATPLASIEEVFEDVDLIQLMTVNPGFGGQKFIQGQTEKIKRLNEILSKRRLKKQIAVDGGIDVTTAPAAVKAGATILVSGSSIYNEHGTVRENLQALRASLG
jgi:ribulose-phosphate 3-epimerase